MNVMNSKKFVVVLKCLFYRSCIPNSSFIVAVQLLKPPIREILSRSEHLTPISSLDVRYGTAFPRPVFLTPR